MADLAAQLQVEQRREDVAEEHDCAGTDQLEDLVEAGDGLGDAERGQDQS